MRKYKLSILKKKRLPFLMKGNFCCLKCFGGWALVDIDVVVSLLHHVHVVVWFLIKIVGVSVWGF